MSTPLRSIDFRWENPEKLESVEGSQALDVGIEVLSMLDRSMGYYNLKHRYFYLLISLIALFLGLEGVIQYQAHLQKQDTTVINLAGRQRMLSQRIASLVYQKNFEEAKRLSSALKENHLSLIKEESSQNLPIAKTLTLKSDFEYLSDTTEQLLNLTECLIKQCRIESEVQKELLQLTENFLPAMDKIVSEISHRLKQKLTLLFTIQAIIVILFCVCLLVGFLFLILPQAKVVSDFVFDQELKFQSHSLMEKVASIGYWSWNLETDEVEWSPQVYKIHGLPLNYPVNKESGLKFYTDREKPKVERFLQRILSGKEDRGDEEFEFYDYNGVKKWVRVIAESIKDKNDQVKKIIGIFQDVSDKISSQQQLLSSKQYLELAIEGANLGIWDWYLSDNTVHFDSKWAEMLGIDYNTIEMKLDTWESRVHPDDLSKCYSDIQSYMDGRTSTYRNIHRMRHSEGRWVYILDQGKFSEFDSEGKPIRFTGTHLDITESQVSQKRERLISDIRESFIRLKSNKKQMFQVMLEKLIDFTESEKGYFIEIHHEASGDERYSVESPKDKTWKELNRDINFKYNPEVLSFFSNQNENYVNIPLYFSEKIVGIIILSGRTLAYNNSMFEDIKPIVQILGEIVAVLAMEVRDQERELESRVILEGVRVGLWNFYPQSNTLIWDSSMYKLYDVDPNEFSGHFDAWKSTLHPEDVDNASKLFAEYLSGEKPEFDTSFRIIDRNGKIRYIRARAHIVKFEAGKVLQVMGINWDVTSEFQVKSELEQQKQFSQRNARLASIGVLAAGVGHEINNPLAIIRGYCSSIVQLKEKEQLDDTTLTFYLEKMVVAADRISKIVNSLRSFSRTDSKSQKVFNAEISIKETIALVEEIYKKDGISIVVNKNLEKDFGAYGIKGSRGEFQQIIMNLLSNAKDVAKNSENKIIHLKMDVDERCIEVRVRDFGPGIPEELKDKIFDPFFTTKKINEGTGIGLSIAHEIVNKLKGTIGVENHEDGGAEFIVCIPFYRTYANSMSDVPEFQEDSTSISESEKSLFKGKRALIVDDEKEILFLLKMILENFGFDVLTCETGKQAFEILGKNMGTIDLVLSDVMMPEMDGIQLNQKYFATMNDAKPPKWVLISAGVDQDLANLPSDVNVDSYFYKPFTSGQVLEVLKRVFEKHPNKKVS